MEGLTFEVDFNNHMDESCELDGAGLTAEGRAVVGAGAGAGAGICLTSTVRKTSTDERLRSTGP